MDILKQRALLQDERWTTSNARNGWTLSYRPRRRRSDHINGLCRRTLSEAVELEVAFDRKKNRWPRLPWAVSCTAWMNESVDSVGIVETPGRRRAGRVHHCLKRCLLPPPQPAVIVAYSIRLRQTVHTEGKRNAKLRYVALAHERVSETGVFPLLDRVSGTLCLSHYVTEISHLYSLRDFRRHFGLCRAAAHSDCCFFAPCTTILLTYLLTYGRLFQTVGKWNAKLC